MLGNGGLVLDLAAEVKLPSKARSCATTSRVALFSGKQIGMSRIERSDVILACARVKA
jgi:hypothetical protein